MLRNRSNLFLMLDKRNRKSAYSINRGRDDSYFRIPVECQKNETYICRKVHINVDIGFFF